MTIQRQIELLTDIVGKMSESAGSDHQEMTCRFEYYGPDDSWSVDSRLSFVRAGVVHQVWLNDPTAGVYFSVHELHELMRAHTGGDWKSLEIAVDSSGMARTSFSY